MLKKNSFYVHYIIFVLNINKKLYNIHLIIM